MNKEIMNKEWTNVRVQMENEGVKFRSLHFF